MVFERQVVLGKHPWIGINYLPPFVMVILGLVCIVISIYVAINSPFMIENGGILIPLILGIFLIVIGLYFRKKYRSWTYFRVGI